jgi:hypothetical protein
MDGTFDKNPSTFVWRKGVGKAWHLTSRGHSLRTLGHAPGDP